MWLCLFESLFMLHDAVRHVCVYVCLPFSVFLCGVGRVLEGCVGELSIS